METISGISLSEYGLEPRTLRGLIGIFTMPLLHSGFSHLASNTLASFILLFGLYIFYKEFATKLFLLFYLFSGIAAWIIGRSGSIHIGASGLVYAMAWFHILSGIIKRNKPQSAFGLIVIFLYGGVIWGIFPDFQSSPRISWQGHLGGAITGFVFAIYYKRKAIAIAHQEPLIEEEDELSEDDPYWLEYGHHSDIKRGEENKAEEVKDLEEVKKEKEIKEEEKFKYTYKE
ncbi:MAG: rhomboid family intramembrane serine protease [Bacteroidales bacterium]|nr:rhomboid family intramembrane serine protease [Bacteroidales bacterium]MDD4684402.1 rhomboid family intramembrane serine protease [Bacteroidales bacterium]